MSTHDSVGADLPQLRHPDHALDLVWLHDAAADEQGLLRRDGPPLELAALPGQRPVPLLRAHVEVLVLTLALHLQWMSFLFTSSLNLQITAASINATLIPLQPTPSAALRRPIRRPPPPRSTHLSTWKTFPCHFSSIRERLSRILHRLMTSVCHFRCSSSFS